MRCSCRVSELDFKFYDVAASISPSWWRVCVDRTSINLISKRHKRRTDSLGAGDTRKRRKRKWLKFSFSVVSSVFFSLVRLVLFRKKKIKKKNAEDPVTTPLNEIVLGPPLRTKYLATENEKKRPEIKHAAAVYTPIYIYVYMPIYGHFENINKKDKYVSTFANCFSSFIAKMVTPHSI